MSTFKLEELAAQAGVSVRTVRYYVQRGLLPPPDFHGRDTSYRREHLSRLRAIKKLQQAHLPLEEIQARLAAATLAEVERMAETDYVRVVAPDRAPLWPPVDGPPPKNTGPYRQPPSKDPLRDPTDSVYSPPPVPWGAGQAGETARVYRLTRGVELWVRDDAPPWTRALVQEILDRYAQQPPSKEP